MKKRKNHKKKSTSKKIIPLFPSKKKDKLQIVFSTFKITYEPILEKRFKKLPDNVKQEYIRCYELISTDIKEAISILEKLVNEYPTIPEFVNNLAAAYSMIGERKKTILLAEENYKKNPEYLFAKTGYAEVLLYKKEYEKIAEIFDYRFDLKMLYPDRDTFHITEVIAFYGVMGFYYLGIAKMEQAKDCYKLIKEYGPEYEMTKRLEKKLTNNIFL